MSFKASISKYLFLFVHCFGIIIKEKCSPFNQGIIQQPIMSINKVITPMTKLSEPPSYSYCDIISLYLLYSLVASQDEYLSIIQITEDFIPIIEQDEMFFDARIYRASKEVCSSIITFAITDLFQLYIKIGNI